MQFCTIFCFLVLAASIVVVPTNFFSVLGFGMLPFFVWKGSGRAFLLGIECLGLILGGSGVLGESSVCLLQEDFGEEGRCFVLEA